MRRLRTPDAAVRSVGSAMPTQTPTPTPTPTQTQTQTQTPALPSTPAAVTESDQIRPPLQGADPPANPGPREPLTTLRGAGANVDVRRAGQVVVALVLATCAVLAVVFLVAGIDKNRQIDELRNDGVRVAFTVTSCQGLLGGSGSNPVGYACRGTYRLGGHTYSEALPGTALFAPGASVKVVAVPSDPGLVSPVAMVESEHTSSRVFVLPAVLFVAFVVGVAAVLLRRRRAVTSAVAQGEGGGQPADGSDQAGGV
jgi:hypothetical protein